MMKRIVMDDVMFKRKIYNKLLEWKSTFNDHALFLEGARRIGKSTIAQEFAEHEYDDYLIFDFALENEDVKNEFRNNIGNLNTFFRNIFLLKDKTLVPHKSLIIFDEVQLFPLARQAIKYLVKDGRFDYIETGSLISIKKNKEKILIPSEEYRITMHPMDFEEFLWALGDNVTMDAIREAFAQQKPLGDPFHRKIMRKFREYMLVGGMPQAVDAFVKGYSYDEIDKVKQSILDLYEQDLRTYDSEYKERASVVFKTIPEQLNNHNSHFKFSLIDKNARYRNYINAVSFIDESMIGNECINITNPEICLEAYADRGNFKLYLGDTGLLISQIVRYDSKNKNQIYKKILFDKDRINLGVIMENMVAQMLKSIGYQLYFHEFKANTKRSNEVSENEKISNDSEEMNKLRAQNENKYEIDFVIIKDYKICPIEVKSSSYKTHISFDNFRKKYSNLKIQDQFVIYTKDLQKIDNILYIPVYMTLLL